MRALKSEQLPRGMHVEWADGAKSGHGIISEYYIDATRGDSPEMVSLLDPDGKGQTEVRARCITGLYVERPTGPTLSAEATVRELLLHIGENPDREGLRETPARVAKAWKEWASGYDQDPATILKTFEDGADGVGELVIVHNIPIISKCEHHLADIVGHAHIGYIPSGKIVGLSKLARLADVFGRRLQVQERLTNQIADALQEHLSPLGVGVLIRAHHGCMSTRGVKIHGSTTTTSAMRGVLLKEASARAEFLSLCAMAEDAG
jgi:GTP cyclohydrolase I